MRRRRGLGIVVSIGLAAAVSLAEGPAETYRIQPGRSRRPLEILVRPGDRLRIEAGGCMRDGGSPQAFLHPYRDEEQGLIFIPGITMTFVPMADLVGRDLRLPSTLDFPRPPRIWIDWGRFHRSPLESPQAPAGPAPCERPDVAPYLEIDVTPGFGADPGAAGTLSLEVRRYDRNLLPLNPGWAGGARPDVCRRCDGFRIETRRDGTPFLPALGSADCTLQRPYVDSGGCRPRSGTCSPRASRLAGHVNWGPATFTGRLSTGRGGPVRIARDGDAELLLEPDGGAALTGQTPGSKYDDAIGVEFATAETTRWFRSAWWRLFPFRRWSYRPFTSLFSALGRHPGASGPFPSLKARPATVIGILGIDTAHTNTHVELHPAFAVAIQTEARPDREVWQVFARNWGTGGDCGGRLDHAIDLQRVSLVLKSAGAGPWRGANARFFDHGVAFHDWKIYDGAAGAPTLVIDLPRDRRCSVVEGTLTLERASRSAEPNDRWVPGDPPLGEPVRLSVEPRPDQYCVEESWFLNVP